jgi:hypothetical protein
LPVKIKVKNSNKKNYIKNRRGIFSEIASFYFRWYSSFTGG